MGQLGFMTCIAAGVVVPFTEISEASEAGWAVYMGSMKGLTGI